MCIRDRPFPAAVLSGLAGIAVTYLFGAVYGYFVMTLVLNQAVSPWFVVWTFCLMYLPFDAAKQMCIRDRPWPWRRRCRPP